MKTIANLALWSAVMALSLLSCQQETPSGFLSSATVESDLWNLSGTVSGPLLEVLVREGDSVQTGQLVASVDSLPWILKLGELEATRGELHANIQAREADKAVLQATHQGILREFERISGLVAENAAPAQKKDDLETQKNVSEARLRSAQLGVTALRSKEAGLEAQEAILRDQIFRCRLVSPTAGRVLTRYRNAGELSVPGRPIVQIGRTDTLWADFFIPQPQLGQFHLGQSVRLRVDSAGQAVWIPARVSWISAEAEFTPKGVQTREARNELVFRARALVGNTRGILKRGLPVEVWLPE
ncbi:MAG TPA: HlyD family efflux transporter periplasmic adaptor subunit [Fibrobacteraceae bacterium]|nr:HlyD family efflux transporter periplasmic adaptor subunit [Fibrobacteraceae bacterium]